MLIQNLYSSVLKELKKTEYQVKWILEGNGGLNAYERIYIVQYIHLSNVLKDAYFKSQST